MKIFAKDTPVELLMNQLLTGLKLLVNINNETIIKGRLNASMIKGSSQTEVRKIT